MTSIIPTRTPPINDCYVTLILLQLLRNDFAPNEHACMCFLSELLSGKVPSPKSEPPSLNPTYHQPIFWIAFDWRKVEAKCMTPGRTFVTQHVYWTDCTRKSNDCSPNGSRNQEKLSEALRSLFPRSESCLEFLTLLGIQQSRTSTIWSTTFWFLICLSF